MERKGRGEKERRKVEGEFNMKKAGITIVRHENERERTRRRRKGKGKAGEERETEPPTPSSSFPPPPSLPPFPFPGTLALIPQYHLCHHPKSDSYDICIIYIFI